MSELPKSWSASTFGDVANIQLGKMLDKKKNRGEPTPYLRNVNVRWGKIDLTDVPSMPMSADEHIKFSIQDGDILICEGGEPGRSTVWRHGPTDVKFQKALMRARPEHGITSDWLAKYLQLTSNNGELQQRFTGTTIKHLPQATLQNTSLPVAPAAEQRRIVAKIDSLTAKSSRAGDHLDHIPRLVEKYKQAILAKFLAEASVATETVTFGSLLAVLTSGSRDWAQHYDRGTGVFVLAANVKPLAFDPEPKRFVAPPRDGPDARRSRIRMGDLLLTIVGAGTGDICHVNANFDDYFVCQSVALIRLRNPAVSAFYQYWFHSEDNGRSDFRNAMYGAARPHLSFEDLRNFRVPEITQQAAGQAVRRIEAAFAWIDRLAAEARSARALLDRLDQAVLAKAFRGELVPQDPNDEPACVLLGRIRAARGAAGPGPKRGRRPRAASGA